MRCPSCSKFVSNELADPELDSLSVDSPEGDFKEGKYKSEVTGSVRLVLTCADCSEELAEANFDISVEVELDHKQADSHEVGVEDESAEGVDRYDGQGRPARYQRHYYGAEITGKLTCSCGAEQDFSETVEERASGFEQLN